MNDVERSALVVLKPGPGPAVSPERAGEVPPDPEAVEAAVGWFRRRGFGTGPVVGISFAVTGSPELFSEVLGEPHVDHAGGDAEFALDRVDDDVSGYLDAVVQPAPPDFGPGNP